MSVIFHALLFQVVSFVFFVAVGSGDNSVTCSTSNYTNSRYFNGFELLETTNNLTCGCATLNKPETSSRVYRENHIIDIKNNRAGDIYLNINGIPHRTTDSLPQYENYHYKFALFSEKDVLWLISPRNMPKSNVSYEFILSPGSHVSSRDGQKFPYYQMNVDRRLMSAKAFLILCKDRVFREDKISSFSQMSSTQVATINVTVGPERDVHQPENGNFTWDCKELEKPYHSPIVSITKYGPSRSPRICEPRHVQLEGKSLARVFVVDIKAGTHEDRRNKRTINLEVVDKGAAEHVEVVAEHVEVVAEKTVIVLRSQEFTQFRANIARELQASNIEFVIDEKVQLAGEGSAKRTVESLDFLGDDYTTLRKSVEERFKCKLISYVQYDSRTDLVFLSLSEPDERIGAQVADQRLIDEFELNMVATLKCERDSPLKIPVSMLGQYGLTSKNVRVSVGSEICNREESGKFVSYSLINCGAGVHIQPLQIKVTFRTQEKHLLPLPVKESEELDIPLDCLERSVPDTLPSEGHGARMVECDRNTFYIKIPNEDLKHLDVSSISQCVEPDTYYYGYTEFKFVRDSGVNCRVALKDGVFRITIPAKANDYEATTEPIEFSCKPITIEAKYHLEVFEDFNMRNRVIRSPINVKPKEEGADAATYHFKISLDSNDPSLAVYISKCSLKEDSRIVQRLIENNCLASSAVSFFRSPFGSTAQHFAVDNMAGFLQENRRLRIECDASACSVNGTYHTLVIKPPQCWHLHGDGCTRNDINSPNRLASYSKDTVSSNTFQLASTLEVHKSSLSIEAPILIILALAAFFLGCIFVSVLCLIKRRYRPERAHGRRKTMKSGPDFCAECGSSQSTESTKTNGSSFSSLFCLKSGKPSSSSSATTSSKDSFEMMPFIPSATTQSHNMASSTGIVNSKRNKCCSPTSSSSGRSTNRGDLSVLRLTNSSCSQRSVEPTRLKLGITQRTPEEQHDNDQRSSTSYVFSSDGQ